MVVVVLFIFRVMSINVLKRWSELPVRVRRGENLAKGDIDHSVPRLALAVLSRQLQGGNTYAMRVQ